MDVKGDIGLAGMRDPRDPLRRAMLGGVLKGSELLLLCSIFQSMWVARSTVIAIEDEVPRLSAMASQIRDLREVRAGIVEALSDAGNVLDSATPRLAQLRESARISYQRAMRIMERIAARDDLKPILQSDAIASRGDRLVLEVKSSHRGSVPGIVHDVSASGQTAFVEPFTVVNAANEWRESAYEAEKERRANPSQIVAIHCDSRRRRVGFDAGSGDARRYRRKSSFVVKDRWCANSNCN